MSDIGSANQEPLDRKDVLREQFDTLDGTPKQDAAPVDDGKVTEAESKDVSSPHFGKPAGRPRDDQGKFLPGRVATPAVQANQPTDQPAAASPDPWAVAPPTSWKPHMRDGWGKLDPTVQKYVHDREQEMRAGVEPLLPKAQLADAITKAAAPYMQTIQGLGIDLPTAVEGLMRLDSQLRTLPFQQKLQVLHQTLLSYGIDISGQMPQAQQTISPDFEALRNQQLATNAQLAALREESEAMKNQAALEQIELFQRTQSPEYFDDVKPLMADLLDKRMATSIDDAYNKAIRLTPEIFDKVQQSKQAAAEAEKKKVADEAAKRARAAAVSVKSATPGYQTNTNAKDRRSILREQLEGLSERL